MIDDQKKTITQPNESSINALSAETDEDLLAYISWKDDDPDIAKQAWAEFYSRHAEFLYGVCYQSFVKDIGIEGVKDLVADTFLKVWDYAAQKFTPAEKPKDDDSKRLRIRAWLAAITKNMARDNLSGQNSEVNLDIEHWQDIPEESSLPKSLAAEITGMLMESILNEKEQEILRITYLWYDPDKANQHLPNDICEKLRQQLQITSENIRQIRARALKKVQTAFCDLVKKNLNEEEQSVLNTIFCCSNCDESNTDKKISKKLSGYSWQIAKLALEKLKDVCVNGRDSIIIK